MKKLIETIRQNKLLTTFLGLLKSSELDLSSIAVAYYMILTSFPFLVLVANLLPYLNIDTAQLLTFLRESLPEQLYQPLSGMVRTIFGQPSSGFLLLSVLSGLWTISKGVTYLQKALNKAYGQQDHRDFFLGRLLGMVIGFLTVLFLLGSLLVSTFGRPVLDFLRSRFGMEQWLHDLLSSLIQPLTFAIFILALGVLYYLLPNVRIDQLRFILPGTLFTSLTFLLVTTVFSNLVTQVINRMDNLRSVSSIAIFVMMFWFIFFAKILILGGICNATYQKVKQGQLEPRHSDVVSLIQSHLGK